MARKEVITKNELFRCGFELARREGITEVTARKLAAKAGCSTQPIFRIYRNMDDLLEQIMDHAVLFYEQFYENYQKSGSDVPFLDLGLSYIGFARQEKKLFQMMFLKEDRKERSLYEMINGRNGHVMLEINKAKSDGCLHAEDLFMKMWIFIHGIACMVITGDYDLADQETETLLTNAYHSMKE